MLGEMLLGQLQVYQLPIRLVDFRPLVLVQLLPIQMRYYQLNFTQSVVRVSDLRVDTLCYCKHNFKFCFLPIRQAKEKYSKQTQIGNEKPARGQPNP